MPLREDIEDALFSAGVCPSSALLIRLDDILTAESANRAGDLLRHCLLVMKSVGEVTAARRAWLEDKTPLDEASRQARASRSGTSRSAIQRAEKRLRADVLMRCGTKPL